MLRLTKLPRPTVDSVANLGTIALAICAVLLTVKLLRRPDTASANIVPNPAAMPRAIDNWRRLTTAGQWMGQASAPVTIIEFSDYQCPFCANLQPALRSIRRKHGDKVAVLYRHYPLTRIHMNAFPAAVAAECAARQGRFEALHDALFANQSMIGLRSWQNFASDVGIADTVSFNRCVNHQETADRVKQDAEMASTLGLSGTPSVIVDGMLVVAGITEASLDSMVVQALAASR